MKAGESNAQAKGMHYGRFALMIVTSTLIMFGLMYLNTYARSHVAFSQTRLWMALAMGAVMAIIMLAFMWGMYRNRKLNIAILLRQRAAVRRSAVAGQKPGNGR